MIDRHALETGLLIGFSWGSVVALYQGSPLQSFIFAFGVSAYLVVDEITGRR